MKVFISWSGATGKAIAVVLKEWIPLLLQDVDVFISPDIEKGEVWFGKLMKMLIESKFGIICVTEESLVSPWVNFEVGVIASVQKKNVAPFLVHVDASSLADNPLHLFQYLNNDKDSIKELILDINNKLDNPVNDGIVIRHFESYYPELERKISTILEEESKGKKEVKKTITNEIIYNELNRIRMLLNELSERTRYDYLTGLITRPLDSTHLSNEE